MAGPFDELLRHAPGCKRAALVLRLDWRHEHRELACGSCGRYVRLPDDTPPPETPKETTP